MKISSFPDPYPIRKALAIAEEYPDDIRILDGEEIYDPQLNERIIRADSFVVGRNATLTAESIDRISTISCNTFLSLGNVNFEKLKIRADQIIFVNRAEITDCDFHSKTSFAGIGCDFIGSGDGKLKIIAEEDIWLERPILKGTRVVNEISLNGQVIQSTVVRESLEDSVDASVRLLRKELDKQDTWDLIQLNRETVKRMGLVALPLS